MKGRKLKQSEAWAILEAGGYVYQGDILLRFRDGKWLEGQVGGVWAYPCPIIHTFELCEHLPDKTKEQEFEERIEGLLRRQGYSYVGVRRHKEVYGLVVDEMNRRFEERLKRFKETGE